MSEHEFNRLLETAQRRRLTAEEEALARGYLLAHAEAQAVWDEETALNRALERLAPAPVPSNFTNRVLEMVAAGASRTPSGQGFGWRAWFARWRTLKVATVGAVALLAILLAQHRQQQAERTELARSLAAFTEVASVPGVDVFQDFEAIRLLSHLPQDVDVDFVSAP